jgi:sugar lactone lactonase YvrE
LFWFDILGKSLHSKEESWQFDEHISAAGWVSHDTLLIASETALLLFDLRDGTSQTLCDLEADTPITRSNDGRADPFGGFWIGTMGKAAEPEAGAIYRYYKGELRCLFDKITISNAICFSPDGLYAYFTDTPTRIIKRQALDERAGWPVGDAEDWLDLADDGLNPDGAVVDADGNFWNAQWGAHRVACYGSDGAFRHAVSLPAEQTSCPAFGGPGLNDLFVTTAAVGLPKETLNTYPDNGKVFRIAGVAQGQAEHKVIL